MPAPGHTGANNCGSGVSTSADHMRRVYGIEADVLAHPTLPGRLLVLAR